MARSVSSSTSALFTSALAYDLPANWTLLVRVKNMASSASHQILLGRRGTDGNGWAFGRTNANEFGLWLFNAELIIAGSTAFPTDTNWHAYAVTKSSSSSASFYRDTTTAIASLGAANCAASSDTTHGIFVGAMNYAGSGAFNSTAELAEIAIFSRVLNSTELGQWMSGDSPSLYATGLVHYWKLDAASGNESATVGGATLTQVGTVGSTTHPTMNYGGGNAAPTFPGPNIGNQTGTVGTALTANNAASKFSDTDALTFSAIGSWPPGVTVSSAGVISGTPTTAGTYSGLAVRATDTAAQTVDSDTFGFTISATGVGDATASGATLTGTSSLSAGSATGGSSGGFATDAMENNTGAGLLANTSVVWTWYKGAIGSAPTSTTHGTGTTNASGILSVSGLPTGNGFMLVSTTDGSGVYYQAGTVS